MCWCPAGAQAEAEARPVRTPQHHHRAEDGRRGLDRTDPGPGQAARARAAEGRARPAGGLQREEAPQRKPRQGAQAGESGSVFTHFSFYI